MIRHVVLLKFKDEAPVEIVADLVQAFVDLAQVIHEIQGLEWGPESSPEGLGKGFTHCFLVTFASKAARDAYLPHPHHQRFVQSLKPWLADVLVVDYAPALTP